MPSKAPHPASGRRLGVFCRMSYVQQRLRVRISPAPTRGHWALLVFYRAVQKSLRMKPLSVGVWEYVGIKKRTYAHTPTLNFVVPEHSRSRLVQIVYEVPHSSVIYLSSAYELPSGAVVRRPMSCRPLSQSPPRDGRSGVAERADGPGTQSAQAILWVVVPAHSGSLTAASQLGLCRTGQIRLFPTSVSVFSLRTHLPS
jgi:hypothetical protein